MPKAQPPVPEVSENRAWHSLHDLVGKNASAPIAIVGAPLGRESITPGRCDLAPDLVRATLKRFSVYDLETQEDVSSLSLFDAGNLALAELGPADAFVPLRDGVRAQTRDRALTIVLGGNNAVTRGAVHGCGDALGKIGLITLDAHFDLRDTDGGLNNGNPIQALLDDGLDGHRISQIGLAPFANTRRAHEKAKAAGISVATLAECAREGFVAVVRRELERVASLSEVVHVDFDIDVIDRAQMPAAPGARPGGIAVRDFFAAARLLAAHAKVRSVDLCEFDPSRDVGEIGALTAARWVGEILAGFSERARAST